MGKSNAVANGCAGMMAGPIIVALAAFCGYQACFVLGVVFILSAWATFGDRRRNQLAGFGSFVMGVGCLLAGLVIFAQTLDRQGPKVHELKQDGVQEGHFEEKRTVEEGKGSLGDVNKTE